jgi:hypothetical protein
MQVERINCQTLVVHQLPDGSRIFTNPSTATVFALNAVAGAAWDACSTPTTLSDVAREMQRSFHPRVDEELAHEAIVQLRDKKLVRTSETPLTTRRRMIAGLGAAAIPIVVSLTLAEQRGNAVLASSGTPPKACAVC